MLQKPGQSIFSFGFLLASLHGDFPEPTSGAVAEHEHEHAIDAFAIDYFSNFYLSSFVDHDAFGGLGGTLGDFGETGDVDDQAAASAEMAWSPPSS